MKKIGRTIMVFAIILIVIVICFWKKIDSFVLKQIYPIKYQEYVEQYAKEYNIDSLLIYSIIKTESNFNSNAESSSKAKGLMQLMDETAIEMANKIDNSTEIDEKTLYNPEQNIQIGTKYYSYLLKYYKDNMVLSLAAYNAGIGNVDNWIETGIISSDGSDIENIPFKETNMYVRKTINNYKIYQKIYNI